MSQPKRLVAALALAGAAFAAPVHADVTVGLLGGITGPIAGMAPPMIAAMQLAVKEVNEQGGVLGGKLEAVVGDSGCNPQNATDAATRVVNVSRAVGVVGPPCSGEVLAVASSVTVPAGVLMVTSSGTSPQITGIDDKDLVFRTVPSDNYQGRALARTLKARGVDSVAVGYVNNDYGKGLAESFRDEFEKAGGTIAGYAGQEDQRASYRSDLAELAKGGADTLVIFHYGNSAGLTMLRQAIENNFFKNYVGADGMRDEALIETLGADNLGTFQVSAPMGESGAAFDAFSAAFRATGGDPNATFAATSYDAAFLMALAIEHAGGDRARLSASLREVASAPGEPILPGEWSKARQLIADGKDIDYKGAAGDHEFDSAGDVPGQYQLFKVSGSTYEAIADMK
ncbi:MAG: ABC transporter substrate-binding protein [Burkholderiaceae bacterium]